MAKQCLVGRGFYACNIPTPGAVIPIQDNWKHTVREVVVAVIKLLMS